MPSRLNDLRSWLLRCLVAIAAAASLFIVAASLWGLLSLLGDETGALVARGTALAAAIAIVLGLAALVLFLASDRLATGETSHGHGDH